MDSDSWGTLRLAGRRLFPWLTLALGLALGASLGGLGRRQGGAAEAPSQARRPAHPAAGQVTRPPAPGEGRAGPARPWPGQLSVESIWLTAPDDLIHPEDCTDRLPGAWMLEGTAEGLPRLLADAQLGREQRQALLGSARCDRLPSGRPVCVVRPDLDIAGSLSRRGRALLYGKLARREENAFQFYAYRFSPALLDDWLANVELPPGAAERFRQLTYQTGETVQFADVPLLCQGRSPEERAAILRGMSQTRSFIAMLHVPEGADVEPLVRYWGVGGREPRVRPLLQAMSRRAGGQSIDVSHLFPPFARQRIYRYPEPNTPNYNCHWTAFNFFETGAPDDRVLQTGGLASVRERYALVADQPLQFGDVISYVQADGAALHSVVYVADDIVFGKAGQAHRRPWVLSSLAEVRKQYRDVGAIEVHLRRRER